MNEIAFKIAVNSIKNFDPKFNVLEVRDRKNTKLYVNGTHSPNAYADRYSLYYISLDKWNRISSTIPLVHSTDEYMNTVGHVALPITMNDGQTCIICSSFQRLHRLDVPDKFIVKYSFADASKLYEYRNRVFIFNGALGQTTLEVTTYEGEKHNISYLFETPSMDYWIAIINNKPHIIDNSGKECPYINKNKLYEDIAISKIFLPADTKGDDNTLHPPILLYEQDGKLHELYRVFEEDYRVRTLSYVEIADKTPEYTYGSEYFKVIDINGFERYASRIKHIGDSPITFAVIDQKLYAVNERGEIIPFEVKDKEGNAYLASSAFEIEHGWTFVCINNKYFPINDELILAIGIKYSFDINISLYSDIFQVMDNETGKYGFMNRNFKLIAPGCVLETDEYNQPPRLQNKGIGFIQINYPAIFRIDGKVGLNYHCNNDHGEAEIKSIIPMGKYASIRQFEDYFHLLSEGKDSYFIVQAWKTGVDGEKTPDELGYGILKVKYLPLPKDPSDSFYLNDDKYSVKPTLIVPLVMSSRQILDIISIWVLDYKNRLPIFDVLKNGNIKPAQTGLLSNEFVDDRYILAYNLWLAMQKSEKIWWNDVNSRESAIDFLGKQLFSETYLLSRRETFYKAIKVVFGMEIYQEMLPLLNKAFNYEENSPYKYKIEYPTTGMVDFSEIRQFIIDKIIGDQSEPGSIEAPEETPKRRQFVLNSQNQK